MQCVRLLSLFFFFNLLGCGNAVTSAKATGAAGEDTTFSIVSVDPATGTKSSVPTSITVIFNDFPDRTLLAAKTHYSMNCGGESVHAASVDSTSGYASVVVTFDAMVVVTGTNCVFSLASNLQNQNGNRLGGNRTATYSIVF
jgi:hypothetical protein